MTKKLDVDREFAMANARVQALIDRRAREAISRMDERWPSLLNPPVVVEAPADPFEAWGQLARAWQDAMVSIAESFHRGFTAVDRARSGGQQ